MNSSRFTIDLREDPFISLLSYYDIDYLERIIAHKKSKGMKTLRLGVIAHLNQDDVKDLLETKVKIKRVNDKP